MDEQATDVEQTRSIGQLYAELIGYLDEAWGRTHQTWVFGEIQKLSDHRSGHCYLDLVDPTVTGRDSPTLKAKCWRSTWGPLKARLADSGLSLAEGSVIRVRGYVDVYAPRGELGFIITALDIESFRVAALGEHARRREELLRTLAAEGLLETNKQRAVPVVPLNIGLVASPGTEGYNDFLGMLDNSGFSFRVTLARAAVQGGSSPMEIAGALAALGETDVEVICVVRGGGSQADLAAFDDEVVARAIALCPIPVFTGIGHTGDVSVADLVAAQMFRTPTACGEALAAIVRDWYGTHVADAARRAQAAAAGAMEELADEVDQSRRHLVTIGRHRLHRVSDRLVGTRTTIARRAPQAVSATAGSVALRTRRIGPLATLHLDAATAELAARRQLLAAYDPGRLLERGWSITQDADGSVVRSAGSLRAGDLLITRFADGVARSTVTETQVAEEAP
jgi:exodeoxyribonuclease VII large subunit